MNDESLIELAEAVEKIAYAVGRERVALREPQVDHCETGYYIHVGLAILTSRILKGDPQKLNSVHDIALAYDGS